MNKIKKSRNKGKPKTSLYKLSNKRLNKLAKQGKLKKKIGKKKLTSFLKYKTSKRSKTEPAIEEVKVEPDIPLHEADYEYYAKPGRNYKFFLSDIPENRARNKRKKLNQDDNFNLVEGNYAKKPKLKADLTSKKYLLPLKSKEKGIIHQYIDEIKPVVNEETNLIDDKIEGESKEELKSSELSRISFKGSRELVASISLNIIESDRQNIHQLKDLLVFLTDNDVKIPVRILAMVSLSEIFKEIIPGYSIRPMSEQETKQQMKKDTKELIFFEQSLLNSYFKYLELLEIYAKGKYVAVEQNIENKKLLRIISLKCLTALLVTHPHFNYRTNIVSVIMPFILHKDAKTSEIVFDAIKQIFKEDKNGTITLEIVRLIGRIIKAKNYNVKPKVLDTFLTLRIKEIQKPGDEKEESRDKDYSKRISTSRKDKKRQKMMKYLEKELKDASVFDDNKIKIKMHTEVISLVFLTYFRILKCPIKSPLLPNVLRGLAKFAHLINVSYFDDIFNVMSNLVDSPDISRTESLHCIQTALTLLIGQGSALNIDPLKFYTHLYKCLLSMSCTIKNWKFDIPSMIACLELLLIKRRKQMSANRCMAFVKRLTNLSLHLPATINLPLLHTLKSFMQTHPQCESLLSVDDEMSLNYNPEAENPDHSNANGATLYELHLLRKSYDVNVAKCANHILNMNSSDKSRYTSSFFKRSALDLFDHDLKSFTTKLEQIELIH